MADSYTKRIIAQVVAVIAKTGVTVNKMRAGTVAQNELPMYSVYLLQEDPKPVGQPRRPAAMKRTLELAIKIRVAGTDDDTDPHRQWVIAQLGADTSLSGLAIYVDEGITEWDTEEGTDGEYTVAIVHFNVEYQTMAIDITAR
jgi:hypothetical protein